MNTITQTILDQLGGQRFLAMTGARDLVSGPAELSFRISGRTRDGKRVNRVRVSLQDNDTYAVQCFNVHNIDYRMVTWCYDVYAEQLAETFERLTGLYTTLAG